MIRIFVGCASGDDTESQAVLEYTLRKHASMPLSIVWMQQSHDPASPFYVGRDAGWDTTLWSTPFSGFRWAVPELCGFEGQAIYMDSDMIVMDDIAKLWVQDFQPGKVILAKGGADSGRFCVSKWDCAAAKALLPEIKALHAPRAPFKMKKKFRDSPNLQPFVGNWNCIDGEDYESLSNPEIKILHYSAENVQPQLKYAIPRLEREARKHWFDGVVSAHWRRDLIELFDQTLEAAKAAGFGPERYALSQPYGPYRIQSHIDYVGNRWSPAGQPTG